MDTNRVDVLHGADGDGGVVAVAHHLELYLLVTLDALFYQNLVYGGQIECVPHHVHHLVLVVSETSARSAKRERRAKDDGITDLLGCGKTLLDAVADLRRDDRLIDRKAQFLEKLTVFGLLDVLERGSEDLYAALIQDAFLRELDGEVQTGLSAEAGDQGVRALVADDLGYVFQCERLHVHLVSDVGVRHDGRGVGVDEDDLVSLFLKRETCLGAGIVKLRRLSDHDRTGSDDHYFLYVVPSRHGSVPPSFQ